MNLGEIVSFKENDKWVLVMYISKRISGVVEEKKFLRIKDNPNFADEIKQYTKARAATGIKKNYKDLNREEALFYKSLQKKNWKVYTN